MKKYLLLLLLLCVSNSSFSQKKMEVVSFNVKTSDISARTNPREDTNGDISALIKVQLPAPNAFFEGNIIGRVAHKTNEYWVYMPQNSTDLSIKLPGHSSISIAFKDYGIPSLESKVTYELLVLPKEPNAPQLYDEGMTALAANDIVTAYDKLEKAASAGFPYANYILGSIQVQPYEVPEEYEWIEDPNTAETYQFAYDYYKKAVEANVPEALYALGAFLTKYNDYKGDNHDPWDPNIYKAKVSPKDCSPIYISSLIRKAADMGVADAQWTMCKDKKWCEDNAKKGVAIAEFAMGLRCDTTFYDDTYDYPKAVDIIPNGEDRKQINYREAFNWYKKAADKGLDAAQWKLGYMYALGLGIEKDLDKSIYWRKKAAEQGYCVYIFEMAMSYNYGVISDLSTYSSWGTSENGMPAWDAEIPRDVNEVDYWLRKVSNLEITSQELRIIDENSMYSDAMYILADQLRKKGEYGKAAYWYQRTGEKKGDDYYKKYALGELGRIFFEGLSGKKDYSLAKKYFEQGVAVKSWEAACYLGILYRDGLGVEKDYDSAKNYFMKSIEFDELESKPNYELAKLYYNESKYNEAIKFYMKACTHGGQVVRVSKDNLEKTIKQYQDYDGDVKVIMDGEEKFVVTNNKYKTLALYQLGLMYLDGVGVEMDKNEAIEFISKAAYRGSEEAKAKLKQLGLPENYGELKHYYELGIESYENKKYEEAVKLLSFPAEQGLCAAQYYLGECYFFGRGVLENKQKAVIYYRYAAQGVTEAQFRLGCCYLLGEGVTKDYSEGVKWTRLAAEKGHRGAQEWMGWCYENGNGVPQNYSEAVRWYKLAAKQNSSYAIKQLKRLNEM